MALPILDGNQTSTTLATTVSGGAHYPNHILASSVTISSLPAISGTVTAILSYDTVFNDGGDKLNVALSSVNGIDPASWLRNDGGSVPISGTVTANVPDLSSCIEPVDQADFQNVIGVHVKTLDNVVLGTTGNPFPISGTVTARLQDASGNNLTSTSIGGVQRLNVSLASATTAGGTLPSFINIHGGTDGSVARTMLLDSSGRTVVTVSNFPATQPVSLASTTVTVSALPSGALTTRFGSVTTANMAQITAAVTNTSRKYLLAQNISAGTVTIGIGFSPTTTQGIQLTAGGGLSFDAFCPTGAVYWLGSVTGAAFTILEG